MNEADNPPDAVDFLRGIAGELAEIHRGSDYSQWRGDAKYHVAQHLSRADAFADFATRPVRADEILPFRLRLSDTNHRCGCDPRLAAVGTHFSFG